MKHIPNLAALTGGAAVFCDETGVVRALAGGGAAALAGRAAELIAELGDEPMAAVNGAAVLRLAQGVLLLDAAARHDEARRFHTAMEEALPLIAQVVAGDVVLFDAAGKRERAVHPDGRSNPGAVGVITELCRKAMDERRPSIGTSVMIPGALAVRIPLAPDYGLAFNNKIVALQRNRQREGAPRHASTRYHLDDVLGDSAAIREARRLATSVAASPSTVLIMGETGTGKELFAQAIHNLSRRAAKPFVAINCGALPASLVESTLFGYADGAFTGAKRQGAPGVFEQADGGTLFLDEISEMPFDMQVNLLRVIQEREVRRVGAQAAKPVDVRILASSNKPLDALVKQGRFRTDLFFRLNVLELEVPPLRARREDIPALAYHFIARFARLMGKEANDIDPAVIAALAAYDWPGNVRELQNCAEYIVNVIEDNAVTPAHLPAFLKGAAAPLAPSRYRTRMDAAERDLIAQTLADCGGNKAAAAKRLGLNRTTLWRILKRLDLD